MSQESATQPPVPFRLGRRPCIDGVRGLASLLVLGYHMAILSGGIQAPAFGFNGVFFVLSGFLITAMLVEEWRRTGAIQISRFLIRRGVRLLPCLLLVLAATAVMLAAAGRLGYDAFRLTNEDTPSRWLTILGSLTLTTNWALAFGWLEPGVLRGTWSLAVEQQFYLLWPPLLLLLLARRVSPRRVATVAAVLGLAVVIYRESLWQTGASWARVYFGADTRADSILIGCALGLLAADNLLPSTERFKSVMRWVALAVGILTIVLVVMLFVPVYGDFAPVDDVTIRLMLPMALITAFALAHLIVEPEGVAARLLSARWLTLTGRWSYPIYLWHTFYLWIGIKLFGYGMESVLAVLALTAFSVPVTFYGVEVPAMRLKAHFRSSTPAEGVASDTPAPSSRERRSLPPAAPPLSRLGLASASASGLAVGVADDPRLLRLSDFSPPTSSAPARADEVAS